MGIEFPSAVYVKYLARLSYPDCLNPWSGEGAEALVRRDRLEWMLGRRSPKAIVITGYGARPDVLEVGVPLVTRHVAALGLVPGLPHRGQLAPGLTYDTGPADMWRSLHALDIADRVITFSAFPLLATLSNRGREPGRSQAPLWARQLIRFHRHATVLAYGESASAALHALAIPHSLLTPPALAGRTFYEQLSGALKHSL